jgi:general secretion pathway protein G
MERRDQKTAGFTLIEIMVVVMIIGMLAAVVGVQVMNRYEIAKRKTAAIQINQFMSGLANYKLDNNRYPPTEQGLEALVTKPSSEPAPKNYPQGGYLTSTKVPPDPWGNAYVYASPGVNNEEFSIESYGADGVDGGEGTNADIESWHLDESSK